MNDRFRFRAWDKKNKRMLYNIQEAYDGGCVEDKEGEFIEDYIGVCCFASFFPYEGQKENHYIVEQCTGLKDNNGKLIYEGDIVKEKIFHTDIAVIKFGNGSGFQCFFPEWKGKYSKETKYNAGFRKDLYFWLSKQEGFEVIGNIHENPELLEVEK